MCLDFAAQVPIYYLSIRQISMCWFSRRNTNEALPGFVHPGHSVTNRPNACYLPPTGALYLTGEQTCYCSSHMHLQRSICAVFSIVAKNKDIKGVFELYIQLTQSTPVREVICVCTKPGTLNQTPATHSNCVTDGLHHLSPNSTDSGLPLAIR